MCGNPLKCCRPISVLFADHYLACDGREVFLKEILNRYEVCAAKFPELLLQYVTVILH